MVVYSKDLGLCVPDLMFPVPMLSATNDFSPLDRHLLRRGSAQAAAARLTDTGILIPQLLAFGTF